MDGSVLRIVVSEYIHWIESTGEVNLYCKSIILLSFFLWNILLIFFFHTVCLAVIVLRYVKLELGLNFVFLPRTLWINLILFFGFYLSLRLRFGLWFICCLVIGCKNGRRSSPDLLSIWANWILLFPLSRDHCLNTKYRFVQCTVIFSFTSTLHCILCPCSQLHGAARLQLLLSAVCHC